MRSIGACAPARWLARAALGFALLAGAASALAATPEGAHPDSGPGIEVAVPPLRARVNDLTATLSSAQRAELEGKLGEFESRTGSQIAVLMIPSTRPETIEQYSIRVVEQWKIGRGKIDDGVLLLIALQDRTMRIEVGYGLEGALTDAQSRRIIAEIITPRFRAGDYHGGIEAGVDAIMAVIRGEDLPAPSVTPATEVGGSVPVLLMLAFVVGSLLRALLGRLPGALTAAGIGGALGWWITGALGAGVLAGMLAMLVALFGGLGVGGIGRGGWGGGSGGWGGGGGGGFRGGGGGFGGGGASGRW